MPQNPKATLFNHPNSIKHHILRQIPPMIRKILCKKWFWKMVMIIMRLKRPQKTQNAKPNSQLARPPNVSMSWMACTWCASLVSVSSSTLMAAARIATVLGRAICLGYVRKVRKRNRIFVLKKGKTYLRMKKRKKEGLLQLFWGSWLHCIFSLGNDLHGLIALKKTLREDRKITS